MKATGKSLDVTKKPMLDPTSMIGSSDSGIAIEDSEIDDSFAEPSIAFALFDDAKSDENENESDVRFRCSRCMHALKTEKTYIGKKNRCPACFIDFVVTEQNRILGGDIYVVDEKPVDVREMHGRANYVSFRCPICQANIGVRPEQAGQKMACPDCHHTIIVPKTVPKKANELLKKKLDSLMDGLESPPEIYGLSDGLTAAEEPEKRFAVYCQLCNTMMHATDEQIGKKLLCPDCGRKTVVTKPDEKEIETHVTKNFEGTNQYELAEPNLVAAVKLFGETVTKAEPELIPVICSLCETRMYAEERLIGAMKTCPDCGTKTMIVRPLKVDAATGSVQEVEIYGVSAPNIVVRPTVQEEPEIKVDEKIKEIRKQGKIVIKPRTEEKNTTHTQTVLKSPMANTESPQRRAHTERAEQPSIPTSVYQRAKLPRYPLTNNLLAPLKNTDFLFRLTVPIGVGTLVAAIWAISLSVNLISAVFFLLSAVFFTFVWLAILCTYAMSVFNSTASGSDDCGEFLEFTIADGIGHFFWMGCAFVVGLAPGSLLVFLFRSPNTAEQSSMLGGNPLEMIGVLALSHIVFFPLTFLSLIEVGLPLPFLANNTLASLLRVPLVWIGHCIISVPIYAILIGILGLLAVSAAFNSAMFVAILAFVFFASVSVLTMLLFRLLGRLAWAVEDEIRGRNAKSESVNKIKTHPYKQNF